MSELDTAVLNHLRNVEARSGKTLAQMQTLLAASGAVKFAEKRQWLKDRLGLGHGDANAVVTMLGKGIHVLPADGTGLRQAKAAADGADPLAAIYAGAKAALRPLHEAVMAQVHGFGDFDEAPKKTYISLRRKKQFAMIGPATKSEIEIGLNHKSLPPHPRLKVLAPGGMCQLTTRVSSLAEVDATLVGWLRAAYDAAG